MADFGGDALHLAQVLLANLAAVGIAEGGITFLRLGAEESVSQDGFELANAELCAFDAHGQLLSASFMDYAMPRADMLPSFTTDISEVLTPTNRLGVRGAGEGGTTGALGAVVNAVVDALAEFGVTHIEMPVTPEKIWRAIHSAKK